MFRRAWPDILEELKSNKKFVWMMVAPNASVTGYDGRTLTVSFAHSGALTAFTARQENVAILGQSINKVLGVNVELAIAAGGSAPAGGSGPKVDRRPEPAVTNGPAESAPQQHTAPSPSSAPAPGHPGRGTAPLPATPQDAAPPASRPEPVAPEPMAAPPAAPAAPQPAAPRPVVQPAQPQASAQPAAPRPVVRQEPVQPPADVVRQDPAPVPERPAPAVAPSDEDPGYGPEPTWDSEPWDDGGGDWDASSVPVPDWEPDLGTAGAEPARDPGTAAPAPAAGGTSRPAAPAPTAPAAPKGYVAPAPSLGVADRPVAPPPGASAATWGMPVPAPAPAAENAAVPGAPAGPPAGANGGKLSRYQRLMNRAAGITGSAPAPAPITTDPAAGAWGNPDDAPDFARPRPAAPDENPRTPEPSRAVELDDTEFVPSDDDIEIEDSSLIGVPAIERILNGRIIEERDAQGNVIERANRPR